MSGAQTSLSTLSNDGMRTIAYGPGKHLFATALKDLARRLRPGRAEDADTGHRERRVPVKSHPSRRLWACMVMVVRGRMGCAHAREQRGQLHGVGQAHAPKDQGDSFGGSILVPKSPLPSPELGQPDVCHPGEQPGRPVEKPIKP